MNRAVKSLICDGLKTAVIVLGDRMNEKEFEPTYLYRWKWECNYMGTDYSDHYVVYSHHRDSDMVNQSNYESIKGYLDDHNAKYSEIRFNDWLVGWFESIMIRDDRIDDLRTADQYIGQLEDYPLLDEDDYLNRRYERTLEIYRYDIHDKNGLYSYYGVEPVRECMKIIGNKRTIRELRKRDVLCIIDLLMED